jgi:glucose/arabinose dehydrogenase
MFRTQLCWVAIGWLWVATSLASAQTLNDPTLVVTEVAAGLSAPTGMAFIGPNDILVLQKNNGWVRRVLDGVLQPGPVLDVAVDQTSERGLLGIALHPAFPVAPWVYLYYTESGTGADTFNSPPPLGNRIYRFRWDGTSLVEPILLLHLPVLPGPNHDGGAIIFGPDGKLYAMIGDLNHRGQLQNLPAGPAADDTSVIFRLNDDGTVPSDNPFFHQGGNLAKYYAYGIRNGFGLAFDPVTRKLWMSENGPAAYDEINLIEPGSNSGWVQIMGPVARSTQGLNGLFQLPGSFYTDPKFSWLDTVAPTALMFLNSSRLGEQYHNDLFVGDINFGNLYRFRPTPTRDAFHLDHPGLSDLVADTPDEVQDVLFGAGFGGITDLKVGPDGRLYILSFQGEIFAVSQQSAPLKAAFLEGTVTDPGSGTPLGGVLVRGRSIDPPSSLHLYTRTDASGVYTLNHLPPGRYRVFFVLDGHRAQWKTVPLWPGKTATLNVQLPTR